MGATGLLLGSGLTPAFAFGDRPTTRLTILHTNDWHSRIDPFPEGSGRNSGQGGVVRRARKIEQLRAELDQMLLLDSGDIFQGTPYFNLYTGELELKLMSQMGYDAAHLAHQL